MGKRTKAETERFYRELVAEHEESGLTIRAFAAMRGIPAGTLSGWRHHLKKRDAARARTGGKATRSPFMQVQVVGAGAVTGAAEPDSAFQMKAAMERPAVYEIVLGPGRVLRVPAEFDEARVAALVRAVSSC